MKFCLSVVSLSIEKIEMSMFLSDYIFTSHNQLQQKSLRGYFYESRDGITSGAIINIRRLRSFLHTFVVTFMWTRDIFHLLPVRRDPTCSRRYPGIAGTMFSIYIPLWITSRRNISLKCKTRDCLFNFLFLKKQPSRAAWKMIPPKWGIILKRIQEFTSVNQQKY